MRYVLLVLLVALLGCGTDPEVVTTDKVPIASTSSLNRVVLYAGAGVWAADASDIRTTLTSMGVASDMVTSLSGVDYSLYSAIIMPGGWAPTIGSGIPASEQSRLKAAIANGLNYLGHCAGGFLLGNYYPQYFGFYNAGLDYPSFYYRGKKIFADRQKLWDGKYRYILYYYGPDLTPLGGKVLGKYSNGASSIVQLTYGKGLIIATGGHPEVSQATLKSINVNDPDGAEPAYEQALIRAVVSGVAI